MKISNLKQLVFILTILGVNCASFANIQEQGIQGKKITDEKLVSILSGLIAEGKVEYDPSSGVFVLNTELADKLWESQKIKSDRVYLSGDCGYSSK